jgi:hypothetical protein
MNKVQFFYNDDLIALERKINRWLAADKDITIMETNLSAIGKPSQRAGIVSTEKYVFYIRYQVLDKGTAAVSYQAEEAISSSSSMAEGDVNLGLDLTKN